MGRTNSISDTLAARQAGSQLYYHNGAWNMPAPTNVKQPGINLESARELLRSDLRSSAWLSGAIRQLDALGLRDHFTDARDLLAQAADMRDSAREPAAAARAEQDALGQRVADGELTLEQAAQRLAELREWLPGGDAHKVADEATDVLTGRAVAAGRREAPAALAAVAPLADAAVREAIEAGRKLTLGADVDAMLREYATGGRPALFDLTVDRLDHAAMGYWAAASHATDRFEQVVKLARELHPGKVATTKIVGTRDATYMLTSSPRCCQLALAADSGWSPGLCIDGVPLAKPEDESKIKHWAMSLVGKK